MPSTCSVPGCPNRGEIGGNLGFFTFPKDGLVLLRWLNNIGRKNPETGSPWKPGAGRRVCGDHFIDGRPSKEHPDPTEHLGQETVKRKYRRKGKEASGSTLEKASSATSPSHRQRRLLKKAMTPAAAGTSSSTSRPQLQPPSPSSPRFSPSGARVFYKRGGVKVKEPTPRHPRYSDPTNPKTLETERRKRLAATETVAGEEKRRKLVLEKVGLPAESPPLPQLALPDEISGSFREDLPAGILDRTFTDSDAEMDHHEPRPASTPLVRRQGEPGDYRPHSSLGTLTNVERTKLLARYITDFRQGRERREQMEIELQRMKQLLAKAKAEKKESEKQRYFGWQRVADDDAATRAWTGFPSYKVLEKLYTSYLKDEAEKLSLRGIFGTRKRKRKLSVQDEFLFTMIRLRTNIATYLLAFIFGIKHQYAGRILHTWIPFLSAKLAVFVDWIPRQELTNLPKAFRGMFKRCVAVLDCFKLQIEKPGNLAKRQKCWSEYKQRYTAKFLVVMSPNGAVMFVSKAWGGRISDIDVVKKSTIFLNKLLPNDELMGDRGFRLVEWFHLNHHVYLRIPAFLKGTTFAMNVPERTRKLAEARIHVERCIGHLRTFKILSQVYSTSLFKYIDDVTTICAAVCNLHPPIVK